MHKLYIITSNILFGFDATKPIFGVSSTKHDSKQSPRLQRLVRKKYEISPKASLDN